MTAGARSPVKDAEEHRLPQMDRYGAEVHLLALTAPRAHTFDADTARGPAGRLFHMEPA